MLKIGLTGGIASGKSVVGEMFVALGAQLVQADKISHALMQPGEVIYDEVVRCFGREILNADGTVNRSRLAEIVFAGPSAGQSGPRIEELNRIVHPAVIRRENEWMEEVSRKDPQAVAIVEAALLLEAGGAGRYDSLVLVTCGEAQRVARFAARQKIDLEAARKEVARRMASQWSEDKKAEAADFIIDNSGPLEQTRSQVQHLWQKFRPGTSLTTGTTR